ncbi:hypothetical protein K438DRAFT_1776565 [Mycena galopus ATCC 62051]|nr:hypothetical protein K438DRAFT_1776565 [Mycena galopus ATCC 62051]
MAADLSFARGYSDFGLFECAPAFQSSSVPVFAQHSPASGKYNKDEIMEPNGIAIIGIAAQLPSGSSSSDDLDYTTFWNFLAKGEKAHEPMRDVLPELFHEESRVKFPSQGAFLKNATGFDNIAFGISAKDARVTPHSARRLLDLSFQALFDSGIESRGRKIGCFMSGNSTLHRQSQNGIDADGSFSWMQYSLANRISYALDLKGPSMSLNTACSSSLTALHLAIGSIERGDCTAALVGAAQINRDPFEWITYVQGGVLSPSGVTRPFDDSADGFSRGEGAIVVVLKPLKDAIRDNDHIYSVVVGSAINATGSHLPLNVPNGVAQQECIREAYSRAGLSVTDVDYVELHATGTSVGDPIETNAACAIFASDVSTTIGTVKGNIGHLEVASFLASLVKACLIFEHRIIPPTVNFANPSCTITWDAFHVVVPVECTPLSCRASSGRSTISLSGSGLGGATGHVVLQAPPPAPQTVTPSSTTILFLVGGLSSSAVERISQVASEFDGEDLPSLAVTLSRRARQLPWRTYFTIPRSPCAAITSPTLIPNGPAPIAFIFSGQGPQNLEMGRQLFSDYPVFRNTILELDDTYRRIKGVSLIESTGLFSAAESQTSPPSIILPDLGWPVTVTVSSIAMLQMALFDLLKSVGIVPDMMLGHSAGETAILYASGAGPKEMAMEIAIARGEAMTPTESEEVGMAMLACSAEHATKLMARIRAENSGVLELSCFNAPKSITVSGTAALLDKLAARAKSEGLFAQRIRTMVPGHSSFMDPIEEDYRAKMNNIFARYPGSHAPRIHVFSTCRHKLLVEKFTPSYFWDNCRNAVLFSDAMSAVVHSSPFFWKYPVILSYRRPFWSMEFRRTVCCVLCADSRIRPQPPPGVPKPHNRQVQSSGLGGTREPILPATGFIELLLEADANYLWDMEFMSILSLGSSSPLEMNLQRMGSSWSVTTTLASRERVHARGFLDKSCPNATPPPVDFQDLWERLPLLDFQGFYSSLEPLAAYGPRFQRVVRCHGSPLEAIAEITGPAPDELAQGYLLHPVILDACLHVVLHADISKQYSNDIMYLPSRLEYFTFYRRNYGAGNWFSHIHLRQWTPDSRCYDILITDSSGTPLAKLHNLMVKKFDAKPSSVERRFDSIFQPVAVDVNIPSLNASFPEPADKSQIQLLYSILDSLAADMISRSLDQHLILGEDVRARFGIRLVVIFLHRNRGADTFIPRGVLLKGEKKSNWLRKSCRFYGTHAVDALYSDDLMAKFYSKSSQTSNVCVSAAEAFSDILETLRRSGKRFIKILEVGAGTGLLTSYIIDELKRNPDLLVEYTVTDISYALVANLARNIAYGSVIPKAYDISKDPDPQGMHTEAYDIVVSLHVLHTATKIRQCLTGLHDLLVPGGCLLTVELDGTAWTENPGSVWLDCVFGSFPEWFGYADGRDHCAMTPSSWKEQLKAANFVSIQIYVEHGGHGRDFFFVAQRSLSFAPHTVAPPALPRYLYAYEYGQEIELQTKLSVHDPAASTTIYLLASKGRNADAAVGLCAALRKETPLWDLRLAIFESASHMANPALMLAQYAQTFESGENVVFFDQRGCAHVQRVVLSPPPSVQSNLANSPCSPDYITVRVTHWAGMSPQYDAFVGEIEEGLSRSSTHHLVCGIAEPSSHKTFRVHRTNIALLRPNAGVQSARDILIAILISIMDLPSTKARLAVALENPSLAKILGQHISDMPQIQVVVADFTDPHTHQRLDILFTDSQTYTEYHHLRRWIPRSGRVIVWDQLLTKELADDPSYLQRILTKIQPNFSELFKIYSAVPEDIPPVTPSLCNGRRASPPFRADRAYALIGGIGGLGVDLAVWMYQHGARHLVLTSRRGLKSLDPIVDALSLAKIMYLQGQDDLDLRMEACDATDVDEMHSLLRDLPAPLAGCFHMALVLADETFFRQSQQSFKSVYDSKLKVFDAFSTHVDIGLLDFFVAFSSLSGLVGLMGQSNYASACTALDGILAPYPNAFSMITPGISDAGYLDRARSKYLDRKGVYVSMSAEALWVCLEDGLRKLDDAPFNQYIPDLDWDSIDVNFTLPWSCRHLLPPMYLRQSHSKQPHDQAQILDRVLDFLEVPKGDFDVTQPLAVYGLDSISAAKLSSLLRPYGSFSQMQLLGGLNWSQIETEINSASSLPADGQSATTILLDILGISPAEFSADIPLSSYGLDSLGASRLATALRPFMAVTQMQLMGQTTWSELQLDHHPRRGPLPHPAAQPLVEICGGSRIPLIILPVAFWKHQICAKRPHGPYRFAAYSASTLFGVALTKILEDAGEEVLGLTFIDHCPTLWLREQSEALLRTKALPELRGISDQSVLDMLRNDPAMGAEAFANYQAALRGMADAPSNTLMEVGVTRAVMTIIFQFLQHFYPDDGSKSHDSFAVPYKAWISSIKARLVVIIAEHGMVNSAPGGAAPDLGTSHFAQSAEVHYIRGVGHYGLFRDQRVARILNSWR